MRCPHRSVLLLISLDNPVVLSKSTKLQYWPFCLGQSKVWRGLVCGGPQGSPAGLGVHPSALAPLSPCDKIPKKISLGEGGEVIPAQGLRSGPRPAGQLSPLFLGCGEGGANGGGVLPASAGNRTEPRNKPQSVRPLPPSAAVLYQQVGLSTACCQQTGF